MSSTHSTDSSFKVHIGAVEALRRATAAAHHQLDNGSRLVRLAASDLQTSELVDLLQRLLALHEAVESLKLWPEQTLGTDAEEPRTKLLRRDLQALTGYSARPIELHGLDLKLESEHVAFRAGCLYVIEGSRLGGVVIRRRLLSTLGPSAEGFTSFFGVSGLQAGTRWRKVCEYLNATLSTKELVEMACLGANQAFSWFLGVLKTGTLPAQENYLYEPEVQK